jgi:alcohol dehydrogenase class IV
VLLPHVLRFNLAAAPERYAEIGRALGVEPGDSPQVTAERGLERIAELCRQCAIPTGLAELGIPEAALPGLAQSAMKVTRLLKNNLRELTAQDAEAIYRAAY